jgi:hypothetical protein
VVTGVTVSGGVVALATPLTPSPNAIAAKAPAVAALLSETTRRVEFSGAKFTRTTLVATAMW